ncbi:MAG: YtxH domain-containing protein [Ktedonobacteraceae bacterium]
MAFEDAYLIQTSRIEIWVNLQTGVLLGLGISLLVAPKTGKEMRQLVAERVGYLRGIPPENVELKQQVQQMAGRVQEVQQRANRAAEMGSTVQDYAQQTASSVNSVQRDLKNVAQQAGTDVPSTQSGATRPIQPNQPQKPTS